MIGRMLDQARRLASWTGRFSVFLASSALELACSKGSCPPAKTVPVSNAAAKAPIVQAGDPGLRARAAEVTPEQIRSSEFRALVERMITTMRAAPGVGLAAPQIGVSLRVIVLEDREEYNAKLTPIERTERERSPFPVRVFVNPTLARVGDESASFFEGCLSVPGYAALTQRALEVEVSGLDEHGEPQRWRVRGWPARILQHEVDHLDGTLYVDRMTPRTLVTQDQLKERFAGKPIAEILEILR
jgi:peptide deformylase